MQEKITAQKRVASAMLDWNKIRLKYLKIGPHGIAAFAIIVFGTSLRILLSYQGWPQTNSDESTMGLMALHIAYRGELPIFFYGQGYMGSLEAYLGAAFFQLFGPSVFALRLGVMLMFAAFLVSMYLLTSLLYTKKMALAVLVILSLGPYELLFLETLAAGGYPEMLLFGSLLFLVACWLSLPTAWGAVVEPSSRSSTSTHEQKGRILAYGSWGLLVGLAIWSDLLILPFVLMSGLLILQFCRSELRRSTIFSIIVGLIIGLFPLIIYNATVPLHEGTLGIFGIAITHDAAGHVTSQPALAQKLAGTFLVALPKAVGAGAICSLPSENAWPLTAQSSAQVIQCTIIRAGWGLGFVILWVIATLLAARAFWRLKPGYSTKNGSEREHSWSDEERQSAVRHFARLMLLGSAALTVVIFALSAPAALTPLASSRYLIDLLVAIPAVIWPLWGSPRAYLSPRQGTLSGGEVTARDRPYPGTESPLIRFATLRAALRYAAILLIGISFLLGTVTTFSRTPGAQAGNRQQNALIHDLLHIGATHIYSDYWTCNRLIFESREQIICSVLDEQLQPGYDRYLPYRSIVRADPRAAYVFPMGSPQARAFAQKTAIPGERTPVPQTGFQYFAFDGYVIYQPT